MLPYSTRALWRFVYRWMSDQGFLHSFYDSLTAVGSARLLMRFVLYIDLNLLMPQYCVVSHKSLRLSRLKLFNVPLSRDQEIYHDFFLFMTVVSDIACAATTYETD
jgi:hypothetical protein